METITITKQNTTQDQIEIQLPYYCSCSAFAYCIISKEKAIQVLDIENDFGISVGDYISSALLEQNKPCEASEFWTRFNAVKNRIDNTISIATK